MSFGAWGFFFSSFDCLFIGIRGTEDLINPIVAGAATAVALSLGKRRKQKARQALLGAVILGLIEGVAGLTMGSSPKLPQWPAIDYPETEQEKSLPNSRSFNWIERFFKD